MHVGKVKHHARLQDDRFLAGSQLDFSIDDSNSGVDRWIQSVDLHEHRVEVRHLRINVCKSVVSTELISAISFARHLGCLSSSINAQVIFDPTLW